MKHYTLITGATSGIGYEIAKIYAEKGEPLILVARRKAILEEFQQRYANVEIVEMDLSEPNNAKKLFDITEQNGWQVARLINNAGFGVFGDFVETDLDRELAMVNLNIQAVMILTKLYLQPMKARNQGEILNVSSVASFMPGPQMSVYYATKAFVTSFSKALSYELKETNIKISILAPGTTATEFEKAANLQNSKLFDRLKVQSAEDVAKYAVQNFGKKVIIPNWLNKLMVFSSRFTPDFLLLPIVAFIQKNK
ncbi:short-chain dehydrogenase [Pasteurellaceae bacterium Orientalotternb1]|nr:short-chain dehydrogenase [Pasteurellaceae bacterium Orientalotternb1]